MARQSVPSLSPVSRPALIIGLLAALLLTGCGTSRVFVDRVESGYLSMPYQQDRLQLVDPEGDARLIRNLDTIPVKLYTYLFEEKLPQTDSLRERKRADRERAKQDGDIPFRIGKTMPIDIDRLLNRCGEIMRQHEPDIVPVAGEEHKWSPEARKYLRYGFWHRLQRHAEYKQQDFPMPLLMRSKLLLCLACGWTARYCVTGQEEALAEAVLRCPDRSVRIDWLFEESYLLNGGNIYLTLLTCENVLAGQPHRREREGDPLQKKLVYIRHDSKEMGDNYGAWYHFFGTALYGFVRPEFVSTFVADTESIGSLFYEGPDRQETFMNHYGALFGDRLRKMVKSGSWRLPPGPGDRTDYMLSPGL